MQKHQVIFQLFVFFFFYFETRRQRNAIYTSYKFNGTKAGSSVKLIILDPQTSRTGKLIDLLSWKNSKLSILRLSFNLAGFGGYAKGDCNETSEIVSYPVRNQP